MLLCCCHFKWFKSSYAKECLPYSSDFLVVDRLHTCTYNRCGSLLNVVALCSSDHFFFPLKARRTPTVRATPIPIPTAAPAPIRATLAKSPCLLSASPVRAQLTNDSQLLLKRWYACSPIFVRVCGLLYLQDTQLS